MAFLMDLPISIIFTTYNRKELLFQAIQAALNQSVTVDIIVMDDASNDGTEELIRTSFPGVRYFRSEKNFGPCWQRNEGARKSLSDIIVFLDDDTIIQTSNTLEQVIKDFNSPQIGAVAIPFINILQDNSIRTAARDRQGIYILHAFVAAAFAIRREVFFKLNGFRELYFYMGEEGDLCIRILAEGFFVRAGTSSPVHHHQPINRTSFKADFYGRRNDILFSFLNAPRKLVIPSIIATIIKGLWFGVRVGRLKNMSKGILAGLKIIMQHDVRNQVLPIEGQLFSQYRYLKKNEPVIIDCISKVS